MSLGRKPRQKAEPKLEEVKLEVRSQEPKAEPESPKPAILYPCWVYHHAHAPEGKLAYSVDQHPGEGWVDTPAKFQRSAKA